MGMPIADYLKLSDTVLDLEVTPNRPDCPQHGGHGREVGAICHRREAPADRPRGGRRRDPLRPTR